MGLKISKNLSDAMKKENHSDTVVSNKNNYLRPAGNLDGAGKLSINMSSGSNNNYKVKEKNEISISDNPSVDEIKTYLENITSGIKYDNIYEFGEGVINAGEVIVSLEEVKRMVAEGYNIVRTKYHNPLMIEVEFQEIIKKGRGR